MRPPSTAIENISRTNYIERSDHRGAKGMTDCSELHPVTQAIQRIIVQALMGAPPASMEREIDGIVGEWRCEPGIEHVEYCSRLVWLRDEMANGVNAGRKHLRPHATRNPTVVARLRALHDGLIHAREVLSRLRNKSLI